MNKKNKIEWSRVTWYSKGLALLMIIVLPFLGFYLGSLYGRLAAAAVPPPNSALAGSDTTTTPAYYANPAEWQTETNSAGGFNIAYPIDFSIQDAHTIKPAADWRTGANGTTGTVWFTLDIPKVFESQTNFDDASLIVGSSRNDIAIKHCMDADPSGGPAIATTTMMINGTDFTVFRSSDAGAGNLYETVSYRTLHAGQCYALEYTIHSSQLGNYPPSYGLRTFNEEKIEMLMQNIIATFTFI